MKVTYNILQNDTYVNIYMSTEEMDDSSKLFEINEIRKQYENVAVFIGGDKPLKQELMRGLQE
jgi:hypothetical protein